MAKIKKIKLPNNAVYDVVDTGAVRFDETQVITEEQKLQARDNIGAAPASIASDMLPLSGGTVTGNIERDVSGNEAGYFMATNTDTYKSVWMGVGKNGYNRGLYDMNSSQWIIYADGNNDIVIGDSAELIGTPTAPTAAAGTNTTQIATTAFVQTAVNDAMATANVLATATIL